MSIRASVVGATGYAGSELVRLLLRHPDVELAELTSESYAGERLGDLFPHLSDADRSALQKLDPERLAKTSDVVFLALPHGLSAPIVPALLEGGARVIDLGADFRLRDPTLYEKWYSVRHKAPELLKEAVYGLPELYREAIASARLIGNPGCYPTAAILALAPALAGGFVDPTRLIVDAKSGVSGAGRATSLATHFGEVNENLRPYKVAGTHRHTPEIEQEAARLVGAPVSVLFTPHLVPMTRGILVTAYAELTEPLGLSDLIDRYRAFYEGAPFVRILPPGSLPATKFVLGSNECLIGLALSPDGRRAVLMAVIDNLQKGAAGQAVQNMNLLFDRPERRGLEHVALYP